MEHTSFSSAPLGLFFGESEAAPEAVRQLGAVTVGYKLKLASERQ